MTLRTLDLPQLGYRIDLVDKLLVELIAHRMLLSEYVVAYKRSQDPPQKIVVLEREKDRIDKCKALAITLGLNPEFVASVVYNIIGESCKVQLDNLQTSTKLPPNVDDEGWYAFLKQNLLSLTQIVAPEYDLKYSFQSFATREFREYEDTILRCKIAGMDIGGIALDIGCATGGNTPLLLSRFDSVIGLDISPDMLTVARAKFDSKQAQFHEIDLETESIPLSDNSVSFAVMNMGTASDIRNISHVIAEVERVLIPGGEFHLSFYNADALVYQWGFLPWPLCLAAELNREIHCLDVHIGKKIYPIYARAYTIDEVRELFTGRIHISESLTYPTISTVLPDLLLKEEAAQKAVVQLDGALAHEGSGAYIIVTGRKV